MSELHTRLRAAIEERLALAKAATPAPWAIWPDLNFQGFYTVGDEAGVIPEGEFITNGECNPTAHVYIEEDARFVAAHDPADAIRRHEAALRVLQRHTHKPPNAYCGGDIYVGQPCDELRELGSAYGVPVDTEEAERG